MEDIKFSVENLVMLQLFVKEIIMLNYLEKVENFLRTSGFWKNISTS